ncbi:hypothetical protein KR018_009583 [Drosophila ironensis]|nr:hypothetical protein KR018_009583 [Drosophila ironensis]
MSRPRPSQRSRQRLHVPSAEDYSEEVVAIGEHDEPDAPEAVPSPTNHLDLLEFLDSLDVPQQQAAFTGDGNQGTTSSEIVEISTWPEQNYPMASQEAVDNRRRIYRQLGMNLPEVAPAHPLQNYFFLVKLYIATNSESLEFLNWSDSGRELVVDYPGMQEHLAGTLSLFRCRNTFEFVSQLAKYGFNRLWSQKYATSESFGHIKLVYHHPKFRKDKLEDLQSLVEKEQAREQGKPEDCDEEEEDDDEALPPLHRAPKSRLKRMSGRGDLCSTIHTTRSPLQTVRCRFQTTLSHQVDMRNLFESNANKLYTPPVTIKKSRTSASNQPVDKTAGKGCGSKFVKPQDSVINIGAGQAPDYAGYYGNVELSKVNEFFSEYLPRYGSKITGYKDIVMDATNKPSGFEQNLPIGMDYSDDDDYALRPTCDIEMDDEPMPSTSLSADTAKFRSVCRRNADDLDLEQAMQDLCEGSNQNNLEEAGRAASGSKPKLKARAKPQTRKRLAKLLASASSSSENENENEPEVISHTLGKAKYAKSKKLDDSLKIDRSKSTNPSSLDEMSADQIDALIEKIDDSFDEEEFKGEAENSLEQQMKKLHGFTDDNNEDSEDGEDREEEQLEEDEDDDGDEDEDDDDYKDKNVQYRTEPIPEKRRRYDLRNSKQS